VKQYRNIPDEKVPIFRRQPLLPPADTGDINILQFSEGREVILTAPGANLTTIPARAAKRTI
jgi:hypothetical protein